MSCDLIPLEYNCIVELDATEEKIGSILLTSSKVERNRLEEVEGTLIAKAEMAGSEIWKDGGGPQVGDRVFFARYAGVLTERDDKWFRVIKDREIVAVVAQAPQLAVAA